MIKSENKIKSKKTKILAALLAMLMPVMCLGACEKIQETPQPQPPVEETRVSILKDTDFKQGFNVRGLNSATDNGIVKIIDYGDSKNSPKWDVAQWWSKYNLKDGEESISDKSYKLADTSKSVEINRKNGYISLGLDGSKEFENYNPTPPAVWPHLLISQDIDSGKWLKDAKKVMAKLDFTLEKNENLRGGTQGSHAQFAWFIYVVDRNPKSEGFGNFLWFGLNIFDSTKLYAAGTAQQDTAGGPGNFIYTLGAKDFMTKQVKTGVNMKIDVDILPHITTAIKSAQDKGFMKGTSVDDCCFTGTNIGWEIFDRFDEKITIYDIDIQTVPMDE